MNYNRLDSHHMISYIYSLKLDKGTQEAEFSFVRFKDKDIKNKLAKDNSLAISLPADLETLEAGKTVNWNGAVKASDETIEVVMVKDDKKQYSEYLKKTSLSFDKTGCTSAITKINGFIFSHCTQLALSLQ